MCYALNKKNFSLVVVMCHVPNGEKFSLVMIICHVPIERILHWSFPCKFTFKLSKVMLPILCYITQLRSPRIHLLSFL